MRILLDENFPLPLRKEFLGHDCDHVILLGWAGTKNGELLARAEEEGYQVLITFDEGIPKDHDISLRRLAVYVVQPEGQGVANTRALVDQILLALVSCQPGDARVFTNRKKPRHQE